MTTVTECEVEADFGQALLNAAELAKERIMPLGAKGLECEQHMGTSLTQTVGVRYA